MIGCGGRMGCAAHTRERGERMRDAFEELEDIIQHLMDEEDHAARRIIPRIVRVMRAKRHETQEERVFQTVETILQNPPFLLMGELLPIGMSGQYALAYDSGGMGSGSLFPREKRDEPGVIGGIHFSYPPLLTIEDVNGIFLSFTDKLEGSAYRLYVAYQRAYGPDAEHALIIRSTHWFTYATRNDEDPFTLGLAVNITYYANGRIYTLPSDVERLSRENDTHLHNILGILYEHPIRIEWR